MASSSPPCPPPGPPLPPPGPPPPPPGPPGSGSQNVLSNWLAGDKCRQKRTLKLLPMLAVVPPPPRRGAARICAAKGFWLFDELVTLRRRVPCQKVLRRWWSTRPMIGARDYVAVDSWQRFGTYHHWSGGCLKEPVLAVIGAIGTSLRLPWGIRRIMYLWWHLVLLCSGCHHGGLG